MVILNENKMTFINGEYDKSVVIYGEIRVKLMIQIPSNLQYVSVKDGNLIIAVFLLKICVIFALIILNIRTKLYSL